MTSSGGWAGIDPRTSGLERLDFHALFGNDNPVVLEIGSGKGRFLLDFARANPELNVVGIEKSLHYFRVIVSRVEKWNARNVRVINHDAFLVMARMIPDRSVREIHIYFPDPWPRRREQKRRIIRDEVVAEMARILEDAGEGVYVTDHQEYFEAAEPVLKRHFALLPPPSAERTPRTNYEAKYLQQGRPIYEVRFSKIGG